MADGQIRNGYGAIGQQVTTAVTSVALATYTAASNERLFFRALVCGMATAGDDLRTYVLSGIYQSDGTNSNVSYTQAATDSNGTATIGTPTVYANNFSTNQLRIEVTPGNTVSQRWAAVIYDVASVEDTYSGGG